MVSAHGDETDSSRAFEQREGFAHGSSAKQLQRQRRHRGTVSAAARAMTTSLSSARCAPLETARPAIIAALDQPIRDFGLWSAFALAFSSVSPVVGIYSVFAISILAGGPSFLWALPVALIGQLLVTAVFGELVSKWPLQGSVYAWSRHLIGPRFGWATNWIYLWGLTITLSVLALAASGYLFGAFRNTVPTSNETEGLALGVLLFGSVVNMIGGKLLKCLLYITLICELIASIGIGTYMFIYRSSSFSTIFTTAGTGHGFHWLSSPFLVCIAFAGYSFTGFEAAGSIAEEVKEGRRVLPKAMILALAACGFLVIYACLGITLAIPNLDLVMNGAIADPIASTLELRLGLGIGRFILIILAIGFSASMIAVQTSVTRSIWSAARDNVLPAAFLLGKLSGGEYLPRYAIALTAMVAGALLFISTSKLYTLLLSFANASCFLSYCMPLLGAVYVRQRGLWSPGHFSLGRFSAPITYIAATWVVFECVDIAWPRSVNPEWYLNWAVIIMVTTLGTLGLGISCWVFRPTANHPVSVESGTLYDGQTSTSAGH
jgi:amino acid transporter